MLSTLRLIVPSFLLLLLSACSGEEPAATKAAGSAHTPDPEASAAPAHAPAAAQAAPAPQASSQADKAAASLASAGADKPADKPAANPVAANLKVVPPQGTRPEMLDTGIDLSKVKISSAQTGTAFPERTPVPTVEPGAEPITGPAGALKIVQGERETHFGEVLEGDSAKTIFRLASAGENPLIIERVRPSCGCTAAEIQVVGADGQRSNYELGTAIPAGTEVELEASINTSNRRGTMQTNVAIYCNDPENNPLRLELRADVKPVLELEPMNLDFGTVTSGEVREGKFTVTSTVLDPFRLTLDQAQIVEPLVAELHAVEPDAEGRSKKWEVSVKLGPEIPEGIRRYPLRLVSDVERSADDHGHAAAEQHPQPEGAPVPGAFRELNCTVSANVTGLVIATPNFISLGLIKPGEPVERPVTIECLDKDFTLPSPLEYKITSLTGGDFAHADRFSVTMTPVAGAEGKKLDVIVRLLGLPEDFTGSFGGMVVFTIGHRTKDVLNVRFSGVAKPEIPTAPASTPPAGTPPPGTPPPGNPPGSGG